MNIDYLIKIEHRNESVQEVVTTNHTIQREFDGYYDGLLERMWNYAKMSGIKELNS